MTNLKFLAQESVSFNFLVVIFIGSLVKIFAEKVVRGSSVQIGPNFPAKSLFYQREFKTNKRLR